MDSSLQIARSLVDEIAKRNETLIELYFALRARPDVKNVTRGFDIRRLQSGSLIEAFIEVETTNGLAFCWWMDIRIEDKRWMIEHSIHKNDEGGQHLLQRFADRSSENLDQFQTQF